MKALTKLFLILALSLPIFACSVFGDSGVEEAPYTVIKEHKDKQIQIRQYEDMILVSTPMEDGSQNGAFRRLFQYISGNNAQSSEVAMTAPVFMDDAKSQGEGKEISMTAPVFMNDNSEQAVMSFVMPSNFTLATTPKPLDPKVSVHQVKDYKVAAITFSGTLSESSVAEHRKILEQYLREKGYVMLSAPIEAAYNGPMTLPWFRKNELLIEIK